MTTPTLGSEVMEANLIDISPLVEKIDDPNKINDEDLLGVVRSLDKACKELGFFYVKGHGISESLMREIRDMAREFFHLPIQEKKKLKITPEKGFRGYQRVGDHITTGTRDMQEAINYYTPFEPGQYGDLGRRLVGSNQWPEYPSNFRVQLENYTGLLKDLSRKIVRGIALALGGPVDAFEGAVAGDPFWAVRLVSYPVSTDVPEDKRTDTGMGAHTDYGLVTLVNQDDDMCALQVRSRSCGEWIHVKPIPGTFVCNTGDMLEVLSNGIYQATLHRVVNDSPFTRVSVVYFYETNFLATIEPLHFSTEEHGRGTTTKYEKVMYGELVNQKIRQYAEQNMRGQPLI